MKIRKGTYVLVKTSMFLLVLGILLTSYELVALSVFPILFLLAPTFPVRVKVLTHQLEGGTYVGDGFKVSISMTAKGFGVVKVMHKIPEHFELSEGSNAVARFVIGSANLKIDYQAIPTKRGKYLLDKVVVQVENPFLTGKLFVRELEVPLEIEVKQKVPKLIRIGVHRGIARSPTPDVDVSKIGVPGTDFREIREYISGDPVKFINWKASARKNEVMVNQYEVEGKKSVWIFLDANPYMRHGELIRNYFEAAVEATNALSYYFTQRGYRVGLYIVGHRRYLYPDTGRRQFRRIVDELIKVEPSEAYESMEEAFENSKTLLVTYKPLIYFITRIEYSKPIKAVLKASKVSKRGRRAPVEVIALAVSGGDGFSEKAVGMLRTSMEARIRSAGVKLTLWEMEKPLSQILLKEVLYA
ncbi:MAG: DUF58 domain-containing protein [Archaeoglobus sp.]|nr:DUF58 domain-containing protein [Archaeoglobus sp.]